VESVFLLLAAAHLPQWKQQHSRKSHSHVRSLMEANGIGDTMSSLKTRKRRLSRTERRQR
jgi:hypothetical protein